jgi:ATP-dependent helicase HrpA
VEHGARARDAFGRATTDPAWHKTELLAWSFGTLPQFVLTEVLGTHVRAYPTLIDRGNSVELTLVESPAKARALGFRGVRRLLAFGARGPLSVIAKRVPPPFARRSKLPPSRAEADAFTHTVLTRVVEQAFALKEDAELPRNKQDFERLLASGIPRIEPSFNTLAQALKATAAELEKTLRALDGPGQQPSATLASRDIRAQLELMFPSDLLETLELERLQHFPRYLRAAQTRLTRAISDPRKDADKLAPFAPLWQSFLNKQRAAQDQQAASNLRWQFEELRVAIFAPELKPAHPVSVTNVERAVAALR